MEDLVSSSSFRSVLSCSEGQAQSAESSWTEYFVDFVLSEEEKRRQDASYCTTEGENGVGGGSHDDEQEEDSMISDAASRAPAPAALLPGKYKDLKKLKKKAFKALDNDDCEDTASSPVNSPKVGYKVSILSFLVKDRDRF
jgi:hypothetical protein